MGVPLGNGLEIFAGGSFLPPPGPVLFRPTSVLRAPTVGVALSTPGSVISLSKFPASTPLENKFEIDQKLRGLINKFPEILYQDTRFRVRPLKQASRLSRHG